MVPVVFLACLLQDDQHCHRMACALNGHHDPQSKQSLDNGVKPM